MLIFKLIYLAALLIAITSVSGCGPVSVEPEAGQPENAPPTILPDDASPFETMPSEGAIPTESLPEGEDVELSRGEVPEELFNDVLIDLLTRTGGDRTAVEVIKAEAVTWPDGSIGCPQPDMMYTQALVDGYQVVFSLNGEAHDYHLSATGYFILCENSLPLRPGIKPPTQ